MEPAPSPQAATAQEDSVSHSAAPTATPAPCAPGAPTDSTKSGDLTKSTDSTELFVPQTQGERAAFELGYAEGFNSGFATAWARAQAEAEHQQFSLSKCAQRLGLSLLFILGIITGIRFIVWTKNYISELKTRNTKAELAGIQLTLAAQAGKTTVQQAQEAHQDYLKFHHAPKGSKPAKAVPPRPLGPMLKSWVQSALAVLTSESLLIALSLVLVPLLALIYVALFFQLNLAMQLQYYLRPVIYELYFMQGYLSFSDLYALQQWDALLCLLPPALLLGAIFGCVFGYRHCYDLATRKDELAALKQRASTVYVLSLGLGCLALFFFSLIALGVLALISACVLWGGALAYDLCGRLAYYTHTPKLPKPPKPQSAPTPPPAPPPAQQHLDPQLKPIPQHAHPELIAQAHSRMQGMEPSPTPVHAPTRPPSDNSATSTTSATSNNDPPTAKGNSRSN